MGKPESLQDKIKSKNVNPCLRCNKSRERRSVTFKIEFSPFSEILKASHSVRNLFFLFFSWSYLKLLLANLFASQVAFEQTRYHQIRFLTIINRITRSNFAYNDFQQK